MSTTKDTAVKDRVRRGLALYRERGGEIEPRPSGGYSVPSCTGSQSYRVSLADGGRCGCRDFRKRRVACKHIFCLTVHRAKSR